MFKWRLKLYKWLGLDKEIKVLLGDGIVVLLLVASATLLGVGLCKRKPPVTHTGQVQLIVDTVTNTIRTVDTFVVYGEVAKSDTVYLFVGDTLEAYWRPRRQMAGVEYSNEENYLLKVRFVEVDSAGRIKTMYEESFKDAYDFTISPIIDSNKLNDFVVTAEKPPVLKNRSFRTIYGIGAFAKTSGMGVGIEGLLGLRYKEKFGLYVVGSLRNVQSDSGTITIKPSIGVELWFGRL